MDHPVVPDKGRAYRYGRSANVYVTGNVWNQAFYRMPRQSIECPAGQSFYRIPRQSIECQADQSFYRMPDKNSQAFYRMTEYLRYSYTETIFITH